MLVLRKVPRKLKCGPRTRKKLPKSKAKRRSSKKLSKLTELV